MDKHAAHERIRFEDLKKSLKVSGQLLAEPVKLSLSPEETAALADNADYLENLGIELYFRTETRAEIIAFPSVLDNDVLHTAACKGAVKANEPTSPKELELLAKRVWNDESIRYCPHGRPIINKMSKYNIEKSFGRVQ